MSSPLLTPQPSPPPTLASPFSSSSLPLAGVRVFLHVRHAPADTRHGAKRPPSARAVLKSLRAQVQQLGATLALSDAAADLIVVHHGSDAFVAAAQERQKTVVSPDYLSACSAAHQRVSPISFLLPPAAAVEGGAAALRSPERKQKSASRAYGGGTPCRAASTTATAAAAHVSGPSPRSSAASSVMLHRPILLDDDEGDGVVAEQRAASHLVNSNEKPSAARRASDSPDASTPRLTPTGTKDALSPLSSLATTQELVVAATAHGATPTSAARKACATAAGAEEGEREEEERIRHAVLCCTAAEGTTRRQARQRRATAAASTPTSTAAASATSVAPPSATSTSSFIEMSDECPIDSIVRPRRRQHAKTAPSRVVDPFLSSDSLTSAPPLIATQQQQQQQQQRSAPSLTVSYSDLGSASITQPLDTPDAPPPSAAPFSSLLVAPPIISPPQKRTRSSGTRVRRAPVDGQPKAPAKRLKAERVVAENGLRSRRAARSEAPSLQEINDVFEVPLSTRFSDTSLLHRLPDKDAAHLCVRIFTDDADGVAALLRDVVVQLGASPVDDDAIHRSGWAGQGMKPTHLVASPAALLTPELLFHKARGVPIVTPQWVYDAIAMGGFPVVVPRLHAHPIFGDREASATAAAVNGGAAVVVTVVDNNTTRELVLGEEGEEETRRAALSPRQPLMQPTPQQQQQQQQQPMSAQLRQLHKEVAEEYVPAGEQAYRPYYRPIFRDCMVYLYVPPVDLAAAHTSATRRTSKTKGTGRNDAQTPNYFGDVVAALEQATQLVRLLGGTVTRNLGSTYLDLVLDLTGFYEQTIQAGQQQQQQQQQQLRQQRALGESLSYAYHDALQRLSCCQLPPENDHADAPVASAAEHVNRPSGPPPIVGIAWLVYSILQRRKADVTPFLLAPHPLAASLAALHEKQAAVTTRCASSGSESLAAPVAPVKVPTPTFTDSSSSLPSCTPRSAPALSPEWTPSSPAPWPSMSLTAQQRKCARGPHAAQKDSVHQLDTQEVAAMLHAAQPSSSSFPHSFSKRGTSSSTSRDGKENGVETYHHHVAASCGEASDVIGL